jgi:hypothetical protein
MTDHCILSFLFLFTTSTFASSGLKLLIPYIADIPTRPKAQLNMGPRFRALPHQSFCACLNIFKVRQTLVGEGPCFRALLSDDEVSGL